MTVAIFGVEFIVASAILRHRTKFQCGDCFYNLGQKVLQILHFVIHGDTPNEFSIMVAPPQPLPDQCCYVWTRNVSVTLQHFLLGGGEGEVSWLYQSLEWSILEWNIRGVFFLTYLSKIVRVEAILGKKIIVCTASIFSVYSWPNDHLRKIITSILQCFSLISDLKIRYSNGIFAFDLTF